MFIYPRYAWVDDFPEILFGGIWTISLEGTLPKTNIAPENGWLEYKFSSGMVYFQGLCYFQGGYKMGPYQLYTWSYNPS